VSNNVPPEQALLGTVKTLERLVQHLGEELASYRKRALTAEARVKSLEEQFMGGGMSIERSFELERENAAMAERLNEARRRTQALLDRVRFLQQQHEGADVA
jgi:hypothetical protein